MKNVFSIWPYILLVVVLYWLSSSLVRDNSNQVRGFVNVTDDIDTLWVSSKGVQIVCPDSVKGFTLSKNYGYVVKIDSGKYVNVFVAMKNKKEDKFVSPAVLTITYGNELAKNRSFVVGDKLSRDIAEYEKKFSLLKIFFLWLIGIGCFINLVVFIYKFITKDIDVARSLVFVIVGLAVFLIVLFVV